MNNMIEKENVKIKDLIYEIRGVQVIFDSDLARLYGTETKRINEAVRRNIKRFPYNFVFKLRKMNWVNVQGRNLRPWTRTEIKEEII